LLLAATGATATAFAADALGTDAAVAFADEIGTFSGLPHGHFTVFPADAAGARKERPHSHFTAMLCPLTTVAAGPVAGGEAAATTNDLPHEHLTDFPDKSCFVLDDLLQAGQMTCIRFHNQKNDQNLKLDNNWYFF
jgi:hypothetical protein